MIRRSGGILLAAIFLVSSLNFQSYGQSKDAAATSAYRETAVKINDLVHTKLDVSFDYAKRYLYGKAWITLKPYAYTTDSLRLDAKGMEIKNISIVKNGANQALKYQYDGQQLAIQLDKKYLPNEKYTIYVNYTAKPDELEVKGSAAITDAKGLYFINPDGADKSKPIQIWTQGETEAASVWFPTIDKPNQKTTQEISMTVPAKYVTLSNGKLVTQKAGAAGTRTDTWKMDLPHSPYLFMMAVGDFKIYKDKWRDKEVNYYLEPTYAPFAKQIFGNTPEMIEFFSKKLGVDYPWNKYSQIVVRDYVSGAMENTTATLHGQSVQSTARELIDENSGEDVIAHELFHQWFGDYVTAESWSNLTVNESFADFSETLWNEFKYGKDAGDAHNYSALQSYLRSKDSGTKNLVRFYYKEREDVFDLVSYQKGGRILNMLRNYLGEDVFFKGLNLYLKQNAFKNGEAHQLRLALEEASGRDLNWFFNQWYFSSGHPELKIDYKWDDATKTQTVYLQQTQEGEAFILPFAIDIYVADKVERHKVTMKGKSDTLTFITSAKPSLVNVDADKILLADKTDNKPLGEFSFQLTHAPLYVDRLEAIIAAAAAKPEDKTAHGMLIAALSDKYYDLRIKAIEALKPDNKELIATAIPVLNKLANDDPKTLVQAAALNLISQTADKNNLALFKKAIGSQSYAVQAAALSGITNLDPDEGFLIAKNLQNDSKANLTEAIVEVFALKGGQDESAFLSKAFEDAGVQSKINMMPGYMYYLSNFGGSELIKEKVTTFKDLGIKYKTYGIDGYVIRLLENMKSRKQAQLKSVSENERGQIESQVRLISDAIDEVKKVLKSKGRCLLHRPFDLLADVTYRD